MSSKTYSISSEISRRLLLERNVRGWSLAELAERSGVSRATISKIEREEASPTAAVLGRLSGAFGLTLSTLLARAESRPERVSRASEQPIWTDPGSGYVRRTLVAMPDCPLELVQVDLPPGAEVALHASSHVFTVQALWVVRGRLDIDEGEDRHRLGTGDSLVFGPPVDCTFRNSSARACRYLVAIVKR